MDLYCTRLAALLVVPLVTTACIGAELDEESEELVGEDASAVESTNGFLSNALHVNALHVNALQMNALHVNALHVNSMNVNAVQSIRDPGASGSLSRDLLRYLVSCAFRSDQTFSFSWTDSSGVVHPEVYRGELGMAPWWATGPISNDPFPQRQITACLAARTNWYGVTVMVSLRNEQPSMQTTPAERSTYSVREGSFWGNLFASQPYVRSCYDSVGYVRARQAQRECAAGHVTVDPVTGATTVQQCGPMVITGACDRVCNRVEGNGPDGKGGYYAGCIDNPSVSPWIRTDVVVTSYLTP